MEKILFPLASRKMNPDSLTLTHFTFETYINKILKYGLEPRLVASPFSEAMISGAYEECSGVLLIGGSDLHPDFYTDKAHPKTAGVDRRRDEMEIMLAKRALKDKKPFLGICRGHQVLIVSTGGTLIQHIPDVIKGEEHALLEGHNYNDLITGSSVHSVNIIPNPRTASIIKKEKVMVNTAHYQAAKQIGDVLNLACTSPEGVVEIVEHVYSNCFCFGVQSHFEAEENGDLEPFFAAFSEAVKAYGASQKKK